MKKFFGVAIAMLLLATVTFAGPAAKHKATGDADWVNNPSNYNQQANTTFNAINTGATGLEAKGSLIYTDANVTYTMDIQLLKVVGNEASFAGVVTSVNTNEAGCCLVGNWIIYKVRDIGEPGVGADQIWGADLGPNSSEDARAKVTSMFEPEGGGPFVLNGGNIQVH